MLSNSLFRAVASKPARDSESMRGMRRSNMENTCENARSTSGGVPDIAAGSDTPPMCGDGLSWPYRAHLVCRIVADGEDEVHHRPAAWSGGLRFDGIHLYVGGCRVHILLIQQFRQLRVKCGCIGYKCCTGRTLTHCRRAAAGLVLHLGISVEVCSGAYIRRAYPAQG